MTLSAPVKCVVFDIDDTLYLERDYVRSGFAAVGRWLAAERGIRGFSERAFAAFERGVRGNTFDVILGELAAEPEPPLIREMLRVYREHEPSIELLPDARRCLDALHGRAALAAISDGPLESQRAKARALDLSRWLAPIVFTAELGEGAAKPSPLAFDLVERSTGCRGDECLYVGDNPAKDFGGPIARGWRTARVRRADSLHADVDGGDRRAELEWPDLGRLPPLVLSGGKGWAG